LLLRDFEPEDWVQVQEYAGDAEAVRYRPFGPCTEEETREHVLDLSRQCREPERRTFDLAIVLAEHGRLIGGCDVGLLPDNPREASLGYGLSREFWGNGYGTETAKALIKFAFEELNASRVSAGVDPENIASIRVLEKSRMKFVGEDEEWGKGQMSPALFYAAEKY
jgi:RimJ/RimL family protein N-acetyltransferase